MPLKTVPSISIQAGGTRRSTFKYILNRCPPRQVDQKDDKTNEALSLKSLAKAQATHREQSRQPIRGYRHTATASYFAMMPDCALSFEIGEVITNCFLSAETSSHCAPNHQNQSDWMHTPLDADRGSDARLPDGTEFRWLAPAQRPLFEQCPSPTNSADEFIANQTLPWARKSYDSSESTRTECPCFTETPDSIYGSTYGSCPSETHLGSKLVEWNRPPPKNGIPQEEDTASKQAALTRYREKRAVRNKSPRHRYENRRYMASQRPRIKGRFIKAVKGDPEKSTS